MPPPTKLAPGLELNATWQHWEGDRAGGVDASRDQRGDMGKSGV